MSETHRRGTPLVTQDSIEAGLRDLGLRSGDIVMVHSSLSSFGYVKGGANAVIDALLTVLGPTGTLCMPTLTYGEFTPHTPPPLFDPRTSKGMVGRIPEVFRQRPGVKRSLHPTHSIAAFGPHTEALIEGHERSLTPCGPDSPWGKIRDVGGYALMIGCGTQPMTMSHGAEEVCHTEVRCTAPVHCRIRTDGGVIEVDLRLHGPYTRPGPGRGELDGALRERGLLSQTRVGNSELLLTPASAVWDTFMEWCRTYPGSVAQEQK